MQLNYADHLWDRINLIIKQSEEGRQLIYDCLDLLNDRIYIEELYCTKLKKLYSHFPNLNYDKGSIGYVFVSMKSGLTNRIEECQNFCECVRQTIILVSKECLNRQNQQSRKIIDEAKKLDKELNSKLSELEKIGIEYKKKEIDIEQSLTFNYILQIQQEISNCKKSKQQAKVESIQKDAFDIECKYSQEINLYNQFLDIYQTKMNEYLNFFQESEEERLEILKDAGLKILNLEHCQSKNLAAEIEKMGQKLQNVNIKDDIQEFILTHQSKNEQLSKRKYEIYNSFLKRSLQAVKLKLYDSITEFIYSDPYNEILSQKKEINNDIFNSQIFNLDQDDLNYSKLDLFKLQEQIIKKDNQFIILNEILSRYLLKLTNAMWNGQNINKAELQTFYLKLKNHTIARHFWIAILQQYRLQKKFELENNGYISISKMINILLDVCIEEFDAYSARKIIILSTTFYTFVQNDQEDSIDFNFNQFKSVFYYHKIWQRRDFWDTVCFESIYEELNKQYDIIESSEEYIERQKNTVFGHLASLSHNMLLLDQNKNQVKDTITKFCKFFNLSNELINDLINQVDNFSLAKQTLKIIPFYDQNEQVSPKNNQQQNNEGTKVQQFFQNIRSLIDFASLVGLKQ